MLLSFNFLRAFILTGVPYDGQKIEQIDLVPTLALLLGIPIPRNSLGAFVPDTMAKSSIGDKLKSAFINAQQVLQIVKESTVNYDHG